MANPLVFSTGTTVLNLGHSVKMTKLTALAQSATAVSVVLTDPSGNNIGSPIYCPATANTEVSADYPTPCIVPGGANAYAIPLTTITPIVNATMTITGAGGLAYLYHR
jgi:hypothetical protein